jgi:transcription termination/antitermination protein NusA
MEALNVDEVVGQLLASEGFRTVEELAYSDDSELNSIDGFDDDTAVEIKRRAQEHLDAIEAEFDGKRKALGVLDELREVDGVTSAIMVRLGENDVKSIEDLAGCATDDLAGWTERKDNQNVRMAGFLDGFDLGRDDCESMIMSARVKAGWIEAPAADEVSAEAVAE